MRGHQFHASKVAANRLAPQLYVSIEPAILEVERAFCRPANSLALTNAQGSG